jgi:hypothetical protein
MKFKPFYILLILGVFVCSCGNSTKNVELNVILFNQLPADAGNHYPKDIQEICAPVKDVCKPTVDIAFFPLTIKRADIGKDVSLDYENNKATNYQKVKAVERDVKKYFNDNVIAPSIAAQTNANFDINAYLASIGNKDNYLIFSDDNKVSAPGLKRFDNMTDLRKAISDLVCDKNISKVIVLYKPSTGASTELPAANTETAANTPPPPAVDVPKKKDSDISDSSVSATEHDLQRLTGTDLTAQQKEDLKNKIMISFFSNAKVFKQNNGQVTGMNMINNYLENLITTPGNVVKTIKIESSKKYNNKIYVLYVKESYTETGN